MAKSQSENIISCNYAQLKRTQLAAPTVQYIAWRSLIQQTHFFTITINCAALELPPLKKETLTVSGRVVPLNVRIAFSRITHDRHVVDDDKVLGAAQMPSADWWMRYDFDRRL